MRNRASPVDTSTSEAWRSRATATNGARSWARRARPSLDDCSRVAAGVAVDVAAGSTAPAVGRGLAGACAHHARGLVSAAPLAAGAAAAVAGLPGRTTMRSPAATFSIVT